MSGTGYLIAILAVLALLFHLVLSVAILAAVSLSRVSLHRLSGEANSRQRPIEEMGKISSSYRLATQITRQFFLLASGALVGWLALREQWGYPLLVGSVAAWVAGVLLMENVVARLVVVRNPKGALRVLAPFLQPLRLLTLPLVLPMELLLKSATRPAPRSGEDKEEEQEEEVEAYFEVGEREGILEADEGKMMRSIVDLGDTRVREIMTPRTDIQALPGESTVGEARKQMLRAGRSRMPVFREGIDNVVGILHLMDLVQAWSKVDDDAPITPYLRSPFFVPETQMLSDLLGQLRTKTNMALVVDEYGGIAGLVTIEDILEEIVGEIRDEHDVEEEQVTDHGDGSWTFSGLVHVDQLEERFGIEIPERDFDTVGGLVVARLGRVPGQGEVLEYDGLKITVVRADQRRVYKLRVRPAAQETGDGEGT